MLLLRLAGREKLNIAEPRGGRTFFMCYIFSYMLHIFVCAKILVTKEHCTRWYKYKVNFKEERAREVVNRGAEVSIM